MNENIKGLHLKVAKILESEDLNLWQKFNSFNYFYHYCLHWYIVGWSVNSWLFG